MVGPPTDITPAALFRLLCRTPRPIAKLKARLAFASETQLHCRALHPREWGEWEDSEDDLETVVLVNALCDETGATLLDRESVFLLTDSERESLLTETISALNRISPGYHRPPSLQCNEERWHDVLKRGAVGNPSILLSMGTVFEAAGDRYVGTPERYFDVKRAELLDGHWMVYRAARAVIEEHAKKRRR